MTHAPKIRRISDSVSRQTGCLDETDPFFLFRDTAALYAQHLRLGCNIVRKRI